MIELRDRIGLLHTGRRRSAASEAARILLAALEHADDVERDALAIAAVATGKVEAVAAVVARIHEMGSDVMRAVGDSPALDDGLTAAIRTGKRRTIWNAIEVMETCVHTRLLGMLTSLLNSSIEGAADRAGRALLNIVTLHVGEHGRCPVPAQDAAAIDAAVAAALEAFPEHRSRTALLAAAIVSSKPGPQLAALLQDSAAPPAMAVRAVVRDLHEPLVLRNLFNWLDGGLLGGPVQRALHTLSAPKQFDDLLVRGHMLRSPARRRAMRRADRPRRCVPTIAIAAQVTGESQRWLPEYAGALGLPGAVRIEFLRDAALLPNALARLQAVRDLAALASTDETAAEALDTFCCDRDPGIARLATLERLTTNRASEEAASFSDDLHARLMATGRMDGAVAAQLAFVRTTLDGYFQCWLDLEEQQRLALAHRMLARSSEQFTRRLRDRIAIGGREERLAAIALSRRLRIVDEVLDAIIIQSNSADPRIASAAVACMGQSRDPKRLEAACSAMRHPNARVRANAIEVLATLNEPTLLELISPMMRARENRVRANAIRAVIERKPDRAEPNLRSMLRDANPLHRVSGLWVARCSRVSSVLDELSAMAITDPLPPLRERAAAAKRSIMLGITIGGPSTIARHKEAQVC